MEKLKRRVLEYLAVRQLRSTLKGPILCFVGPPGVGKTSVGRSIARTLGREFHRIALGGVCDQSDIRGHRYGTAPIAGILPTVLPLFFSHSELVPFCLAVINCAAALRLCATLTVIKGSDTFVLHSSPVGAG